MSSPGFGPGLRPSQSRVRSTTLRGRLQLISLNDRDCEVPDSPHPQPLSRKGRGGKSVGMGSVCAPRVACEFSPLSPRGRGTGGEGPSGGADNLTRSFNAPPRIRTSSGSFEGCYAFQHTRRAIRKTRIKREGSCKCLDPDSNQDPDLRTVRMRSVTPSRQIIRVPQTGPTAGFAPASSCLQDRRLSQSGHVGNCAKQRSTSARSRTP
jgi:hypothetical protein